MKNNFCTFMAKSMAALLCASAFIAYSCDKDPTVSVTGVTLDKTALSLTVGETANLVATVTPKDATNKSITWASSAPAVATVVDGKVTAVAEGTATVTVTTTDGGFKAECKVTVAAPAPTVTGVTLDKTTLELTIGETADLVVTVAPENAPDKGISWTSSAPAVATVANGKVTAVGAGTANITVTTIVGEFTATCEVTVVHPTVTGVTLDKTTLELTIGETADLVATVTPEETPDKSVTWASSAPAVATVADGKVTAVAAGTANITVTTVVGGFTAACEVTVVAPTVSGVTLDKTTLELMVGDVADLVATVTPEETPDKSVTWASSAPAVATVADGKVTAVAAGTATITVTTVVGGFTANCAVTVSEPVVELLVWEDGFEAGDFNTKWQNIDADGDTFKWVLIEASADPDSLQPIDGQYSIPSDSYLPHPIYGLSPNNWAITEAITLSGAQNFTLAWWCKENHSSWKDTYGIFVSTTSATDLSTFTQVGSDYQAANPAAQVTADLSAYAGQTIHIAFRHYNVTDMFSMQIDKVQVFRGTEVPASAQNFSPATVLGPVNPNAASTSVYRHKTK